MPHLRRFGGRRGPILQKLGIVGAEQLLKGGGGALLQGVDSLDQAKDVGSHDEKVARGGRAQDSSRRGAFHEEPARPIRLGLARPYRQPARTGCLRERTRLRRRSGGGGAERSGVADRVGRRRLATRR